VRDVISTNVSSTIDLHTLHVRYYIKKCAINHRDLHTLHVRYYINKCAINHIDLHTLHVRYYINKCVINHRFYTHYT